MDKKTIKRLDEKARREVWDREDRCFTCGCNKRACQLEVGHFINRWHISVRWHPDNIHLQCIKCNRYNGSGLYSESMKERYARMLGPEIVKKLQDLAHKGDSLKKVKNVTY